MHADQYLDHLARDGRRMADLARGDLEAQVPTCPEWKLVDLIEHTGFVHRWQTAVVRDAPSGFPDGSTWRFPPEAGESWADWFQAGVDAAGREMRRVDPDAPRWTWSPPDETARWYIRRITQETAVHRIDAELAATGSFTPVDAELAVDGINEMFDMFVPASGPEALGGNGETVHLHATDTEGEWLVTVHPERITSTKGHAKGDAAVRGTASDLLLFVWGRSLGQLERFGDDAAIEKLFAGFKL